MTDMKEHTLSQVAFVGRLMQALKDSPRTAEEANALIDQLIAQLEGVDLPYTRGVAKQLVHFKGATLSRYQPNTGLSSSVDLELTTIARTVITALHHEAEEKRALILDSSAVAKSLRSFPDSVDPQLTPTQTLLHREVILSLESGAWRAAIVMAWNFAFEYVRHWVFSHHLAAFNRTLTTRYTIKKTEEPCYKEIVEYSDFWEGPQPPGERIVLDTCEFAQIIPRKPYDSLVEALRRRNEFAHSNFTTPDVDLTRGYIAELIRIITSDPFPKPIDPAPRATANLPSSGSG